MTPEFSRYVENIKGLDVVRMENIRTLSSNMGISTKEAELKYLDEGITPCRYSGNVRLFGTDGQAKLLRSKVFIAGCGGLGGSITELCARLGIGHIVLADGDVFEESNLNRQLICQESVIGKSKVLCAKDRITSINSGIDVTVYDMFIDEDNVYHFIGGCDCVIDALDNVESRLILQNACRERRIPMVHGAVGDTSLQAASVMPGEDLLNTIYKSGLKSTDKICPANPAVTVMMCAAVEAGEVLKILLGKGKLLEKKLLHYDWMDNKYFLFNL